MSPLMAFVTQRHAIADFVAKAWVVFPSFDVVSMKPAGRVTFDALPSVAVFDRLHPHLSPVSVPLWIAELNAAAPVRIFRADEQTTPSSGHFLTAFVG
jgi:hypothetical protein